MLRRLFGGLAGELDRRARAWIRANSTMGAGALHKWAAGDNLAPRLPQQALDSEGSRLLTPRCWDTGRQSGAPVGSSIETASFKSVWRSVNCDMKFGAGTSSMAWWEVFIPTRCEPRPNSFRPKLAWERTDGECMIWLTYRSRRSRRLVVSWRRVNVSWPGRRNGWQFSPLCSLKVKSLSDPQQWLRCCTDSGVELGGTRRTTGAQPGRFSGTLQYVAAVPHERASSECS